jgi:hypothetical protein
MPTAEDILERLQPVADRHGLSEFAVRDIHSTIMAAEPAGLRRALRLLMDTHGIPIDEMVLVVDDLAALDAGKVEVES